MENDAVAHLDDQVISDANPFASATMSALVATKFAPPVPVPDLLIGAMATTDRLPEHRDDGRQLASSMP